MAASTAMALPSLPALAAASALPTCLGFWKTGYAVSYGYGGAMAAAAALTLSAGPHPLAKAHAAALLFYGVRLNLFLLYRELALPVEVHQMKQRDASLVQRLRRAPVIVGCSLLYFLMAAPLRITALGHSSPSAAFAVALAFLGFAVAAAGDAIKSIVKARKGADHLVTSGPFRWLRHPNYTGEIFGWSASAAAAVLVAVAEGAAFCTSMAPWLVGSALGWVGILFVLAGEATGGLEQKQKDKYAGDPKYEAWVQRSWAGPMIALPGPAAAQ